MTDYDQAIARAREIGREHGENAAADWFAEITCYKPALVLDQAHGGGDWASGNGGPDTNPTLPRADLSGEWADGYTPRRLCEDCGVSWDWDDGNVVTTDDLCDAYEDAFSEAVVAVVERECSETE